jgi:HEAT repeat protein
MRSDAMDEHMDVDTAQKVRAARTYRGRPPEARIGYNGTLGELLRERAKTAPNKPFLIYYNEANERAEYSYGAFFKLVQQAANYLSEGLGLQRGDALRALGNLRAPEAADALIEALRDPNRKIRVDAARGLRRLADTSTLEAIVEVLLEAMRQPRPDLPFANTLIQAIGASGDPETVGPLLVRLLQEAVGCRTVAARALRPLNYEPARPALERALTDRNPNLRLAALQTLEALGAGPSLPAIRALLQEPDLNERVQRAACETLARLGDQEALPFLREMVSSPNPFLRPRAVEGLALIDLAGHRSLFLELLADNNIAVRAAAVEALIPFVNDPEVRRALQYTREIEVTERLRELLNEVLSGNP